MTVVLARYEQLRASGCGHWHACRLIGRELDLDEATVHRVVDRAQRAERRLAPAA